MIDVKGAENHIEESKDYIELVDKLVNPQTKELDDLLTRITEFLKKPDYIMDMNALQSFYGQLTGEIYYMVNKFKNFEIYSSGAKSNQSEAFNRAYMAEIFAVEKKPSVAELNIKAELNSIKESMVSLVYNSAYKTIKMKIDAGMTMIDTLKNIIKAKINMDYNDSQTSNIAQPQHKENDKW